MNALKLKTNVRSFCACLVVCSSLAWADDNQAPEATEDSAISAFSSSAALTSSELNSERAKQNINVESIQINNQDLDGTVADNVAIGNTTGHNSISGDAFTGAAGFISSVQNTGNNVLIQNATIINVSVDP